MCVCSRGTFLASARLLTWRLAGRAQVCMCVCVCVCTHVHAFKCNDSRDSALA